MTSRHSLLLNIRGASAAEFAMVLPILLIFLLGIIDAGRFMWEYNQAEKATQMGVRFAAVTDVIPEGLATTNYVGQTVTVNGVSRTLTQGDVIPIEALGRIECKRTSGTLGCTCSATPCPTLGTVRTAAFTDLVGRINVFRPNVTADNVIVEYRGSGLGFAGDPTGPDISPLVTVRLTGLQFRPIWARIFGGNISMPDFASAITLEDGAGTISN